MKLKQYMTFEPSANYINREWDIMCTSEGGASFGSLGETAPFGSTYDSLQNMIDVCENGKSKYKELCLTFLQLLNKETLDAELSCDNCLIIDNHNVFYAQKLNSVVEDFTNVIRLPSCLSIEDFKGKYFINEEDTCEASGPEDTCEASGPEDTCDAEHTEAVCAEEEEDNDCIIV